MKNQEVEKLSVLIQIKGKVYQVILSRENELLIIGLLKKMSPLPEEKILISNEIKEIKRL